MRSIRAFVFAEHSMLEEAKEEQPSNLTAEEEEMLRPRELKVVNPLIHEATHQEFLENVKVRPPNTKMYLREGQRDTRRSRKS